MDQQELLLLSSRSEDLQFANQLASLFKMKMTHKKTAKEAAQVISQTEPLVVLVDVSTESQYIDFENEFQGSVGLFSEQAFPERIHFLSDQDDSCGYLFRSPIFSHLLLRGGNCYLEGAVEYGRLIEISSPGVSSKMIHGLLKKETRIQKVRIVHSGQKKDALEAIRQYVLRAGFNSRMVSLIVNASDELLMNAIFDAPKDDKGFPIYANTPRNAGFELDLQNQVELALGFDGQYLGITVTDFHGSLDRDELFSLMSREYSGTEYKLRRQSEGAGLGLATVFRTGASLLFHSVYKQKTSVSLLFKRVDQYKDFRSQMRFVSTHFQT